MLTLKELEYWFIDLKKIIFDTKVSIDNIARMTNTNDNYEKQILNHGFFWHFYHQSRFTIIIQLSKLYSDSRNQKRSFNKLFDRLCKDEYDKSITDIFLTQNKTDYLFSNKDEIKAEIETLQREIEIQNILIEKIIKLRDKYYAHSDPNPILPEVTDIELIELVELAEKVYNKIKGGLLNVTYRFEHNTDWSVDYIIKILASHQKEIYNKISQNRMKDD